MELKISEGSGGGGLKSKPLQSEQAQCSSWKEENN
jgi:hypothetical protein